MFTKQERERYNAVRENACQRLGITKNQYNWLRRKGELLRQIYEDRCNGIEHPLEQEEALTERIEYYAQDLRLFIYLQGDPRGATIYLDTKEIPENNYTQAVCIY